MRDHLNTLLAASIATKETFVSEHGNDIIYAAETLYRTFIGGGKVLICGNGGSAADAQHMAAELVGRMLVDRRPLPAIALTTDSSNLTAIGNDYSFEDIFSRQVAGLANPGDLLIAISTSGNSKNVINAAREAHRNRCKVISLTGGTGGALASLSDISLNASKGNNSCRIQETHIFAIHAIIDILDKYFTL